VNVFDSMNQILKTPDVALSEKNAGAHSAALLTGAVLCYVAYAAASGFFQGGWSVALAVLKMPTIILGSILLCLPSLYVFTALAGADFTPREFGRIVSAFCAIAGLILVAMVPVAWLFSVSTTSMRFVVWMHVFVWLAAILFARRMLLRTPTRAHTVVGLWLILLFIVSLQMTTHLRPVLWRDEGEPIFATGKKTFLMHFGELGRKKKQATQEAIRR
jgi:hypothetical protein